MPKFIIERNVPKAGAFTPEMLKAMSQKSREVLCTLGSEIQWIPAMLRVIKFIVFIWRQVKT